MDEVRERHVDNKERYRQEREAGRSAMQSAQAEGQPEKLIEINRSEPKVIERSAQEEADEAHELLLNSIILKIRKLVLRQLLQLKENLSLRAN
jgi:hypothetical protein